MDIKVWRSVIFIVQTTQREIYCFAVLCKAVMLSKFIHTKSSIYKKEKKFETNKSCHSLIHF